MTGSNELLLLRFCLLNLMSIIVYEDNVRNTYVRNTYLYCPITHYDIRLMIVVHVKS